MGYEEMQNERLFFFLMVTFIRRKKQAVQEGYTGKLTATKKPKKTVLHTKQEPWTTKETRTTKGLKPQKTKETSSFY